MIRLFSIMDKEHDKVKKIPTNKFSCTRFECFIFQDNFYKPHQK